MSDTRQIFTSSEAVTSFEKHTGFQFHPTVPGQLLARRGIWKLSEKTIPSQFDGAAWPRLWDDMLVLAHNRCRYNAGLVPPRDCVAPALATIVPMDCSDKLADPALPRRRYIKVPIEEKDEAKSLGARWDPAAKLWFIPDGLNRSDFRWPDKARRVRRTDGVRGRTPARRMRSEEGDGGRAVSRLDAEAMERLRYLMDKPDKDDVKD